MRRRVGPTHGDDAGSAFAASTVEIRSPRTGKPRGRNADPVISGPVPRTDISTASIHESAHAAVADALGFKVVSVSIREGVRYAGLTTIRGRRVDPTPLAELDWFINPDLADVVRELYVTMAGRIAEGLVTGTARVAAPDAVVARIAFEVLPEETQAGLLKEEAASEAHSDEARAWALLVDFFGLDAARFYDIVFEGARRYVYDRAVAIVSLAIELDRGAVLDGGSVATILAVGEPVDVDDGPPTSGDWTPLAMFFIAGVDQPVRVGEPYPWHDPRVQRSPGLFIAADAPPDDIQEAIDDYRNRAITPESRPRRLVPGPGIVRCIRAFVARTRDGLIASSIAEGELVRAESWQARSRPGYFAPSEAETSA